MTSHSSPSDRPADAGGPRLIIDRVRDRVEHVTRALERRDSASRPRLRRRPPTDRITPETVRASGVPLSREARALRSVFRDLGATHRQYRHRTGAPVSPVLRAAAMAFKQDPSLQSLAPVAGFLDELDLLDW